MIDDFGTTPGPELPEPTDPAFITRLRQEVETNYRGGYNGTFATDDVRDLLETYDARRGFDDAIRRLEAEIPILDRVIQESQERAERLRGMGVKEQMTHKASTYCPTCGVKFDYNADTDSDYYHRVSAVCPNGHSVCCLPDKIDLAVSSPATAEKEES